MDHLLLVWMNVTFNPHDRKASNISTSNIVDVASVLVELLRFSLDLLKPNRLVYIVPLHLGGFETAYSFN